MVTSRKYLTMNIRRPNSVIENIDSSSSSSTSSSRNVNSIGNFTNSPKKIVTIPIQTTPQPKTYLPLKRNPNSSLNTNKKPTSLNSSLTNTSNDLNTHNSSSSNTDHMSLVDQIKKRASNEQERDYEYGDDEEENEALKTTSRHLEKKKIEIINIPTKRLVNPSTDNSRLRQSFFMSEFSSKSNQKENASPKAEMNISNIQATFQRYENEHDNLTDKSSDDSKMYANTSHSSEYSSQYYTNKYPSNTLPSKHTINKSTSSTRSSKKTNDTGSSQMKSSNQNVSTSHVDENRVQKKLLNSQHTVNVNTFQKSQQTPKTATLSKSATFKKKSPNHSILSNGSTHACNQLNISTNSRTSDTGSKYTLYNKKAAEKNSFQVQTSKSVNFEQKPKKEVKEEVVPKIDHNAVLVDQMASFIDELKDFIDDRLIDTTSQLEIANQRISGLYYNLNYLTKEFIELKNQNEELKIEIQQSTQSNYYHKSNSRRKNRTGSFNTKIDDCEPIAMNSSSKTSSIGTTSSSTSESLVVSQSGLASSSQESHHRHVQEINHKKHQDQEENIRHLSRDEMILLLKNKELEDLNEKYGKLASSSSSVNSVNFYDNMSTANKLEANWPENNFVDQNQYLRTSSQIELNNIAQAKYISNCEFENEEENNYDREIIIHDDRRRMNNYEIDPYESKFNKLKEDDFKKSLKHENKVCNKTTVVNSKIIHHIHAPTIPYTNFRDFDAQYSWDYTDNLVNKFTGKIDNIKQG